MTDKNKTTGEVAAPPRAITAVVVRSDVPPGLPHTQYKRYLRHDFYYSCAYCTMTEGEAQAIRMLIDHYQPISAEGADIYSNLMYCCEECNLRKGDLWPPLEAQDQGKRFFRIDAEPRSEHFDLDGTELKGTTEVGKFTVDFVDLNRVSG